MHRLPEALQLRGRPLPDIREEIAGFLDLVGASEIAERAGVERSAVNKWQDRYEDFPGPVAELAQGRVWFWPEVEAFIEQRKLARGRGRPSAE
jgi:hypothetical protein